MKSIQQNIATPIIQVTAYRLQWSPAPKDQDQESVVGQEVLGSGGQSVVMNVENKRILSLMKDWLSGLKCWQGP